MKRVFFSLIPILAFTGLSYSQSHDDGLISSRLSINTNQEKYVSFIDGFKSGLNKVKNGELTSGDAIASYYGVDIRTYPKLTTLLASTNNNLSIGGFSSNFLAKLNAEIEKVGNEYDHVDQFRNGLLDLALTSNLSLNEAEALVLVDISIQEVKNNITTTGVAHQVISYIDSKHFNSDILNFSTDQFSSDLFCGHQDIRMPRWVRCALGTIGSAIIGGLGGGASGAQIGAIFGPGGAAVGAAVGGIGGFIGGAFTGVAAFCD